MAFFDEGFVFDAGFAVFEVGFAPFDTFGLEAAVFAAVWYANTQ